MHQKIKILVICLSAVGCLNKTPQSYTQGINFLQNQQYKQADQEFQQLLQHHPSSSFTLQAAEKAAQTHFNKTQQYFKALAYYKHIVQFSKDKQLQKKSQQQIAAIYFYKVFNYHHAIKAYSDFLLFDNSLQENFEARYNMARAYFYLNNFFQAQVEAQDLLKYDLSKTESFDVELLVAQILFSSHKIDKALSAYRQLVLKYPKKSVQEKVRLNIAACLEEQKQFSAAIEELEKMKNFYKDTDFIDLRIKKLQLHKANRPKTRRAI